MTSKQPSKARKLKGLLSRFDLKLRLKAPFLDAEVTFKNNDKKAAWELYIELLTRIATQKLPDNAGIEQTALDSVYSIFDITREVLKKYGSGAVQFSYIAIPVLNQIIRPFTAKWHRLSEQGALNNVEQRAEFRAELKELQKELKKYNRLLAEVAGVEDLTELEDTEPSPH